MGARPRRLGVLPWLRLPEARRGLLQEAVAAEVDGLAREGEVGEHHGAASLPGEPRHLFALGDTELEGVGGGGWQRRCFEHRHQGCVGLRRPEGGHGRGHRWPWLIC